MAHIRARIYLRGFVGMMQKKMEATVWGLGLTRHSPKNSLRGNSITGDILRNGFASAGFVKLLLSMRSNTHSPKRERQRMP